LFIIDNTNENSLFLAQFFLAIVDFKMMENKSNHNKPFNETHINDGGFKTFFFRKHLVGLQLNYLHIIKLIPLN